ncbi:plasmid pRiA4b ORF-3 family protein [Frankia sp. CiP1_Cm_nod2]|uniref:plasmid pRiA4b ORF-3 family protein n=1 Tax=Frankia sp. CiP1_Cm_nod2 TaxID=2897161 RepID=UPI0020259F3C
MSRVPDTQGTCDCPACSGADGLGMVVGELTTNGELLLTIDDPMEAEVLGATLVSASDLIGEDAEEAFTQGLVPALESTGAVEALATLLAIGSVSPGRLGAAANDAADRLAEAGITRPVWADELQAPVTADGFQRLDDDQETASILVCSFHRAGRGHAVIINVDRNDCGAAADVLFLDADKLPEAVETLHAAASSEGVRIRAENLSPEEFRWQAENALAARAVHDAGDVALNLAEFLDDEDDSPAYPALAMLLRARLATLPEPGRPPAPHPTDDEDDIGPDLTRLLIPGGFELAPSDVAPSAALPAKRKKAAGPAPVYQIKVVLRGTKPPIWRRLEVPADIRLDRLHTVIQAAFGWYDTHLHVFETQYGSFSSPDADPGYRAEAAVTLEQVVPTANDKIFYTYDFGDSWEHDILLEKVLSPDPTVRYPRCTGGRRAAPPEDCGGIWGYAELLQVLKDPDHPEHDEKLEWLGVDNAVEFAPERFDTVAVNQALSAIP